VRPALALAVVEEVLHQPQLAVAADERRLQALRLQRPARAGDDPPRAPERNEPDLPLQDVGALVLVHDRRLGGSPRRLAHEHLARLRDRLDAGRRVDDVACDHALALGADRHRGLTGEHARAGPKVSDPDLVTERRDSGNGVERRADGSLGVVLRCGRRAPDGHHGVADELLDRAAVQRDQPAAGVEVAREELSHLLLVAPLGQRGESDEVGEEDRDEPAFGGGRLALLMRLVGLTGEERATAVVAELPPRLVRGSARGAADTEGRTAVAAELRGGAILATAVRADHRVSAYACAVPAQAPARRKHRRPMTPSVTA